MKKSNPHPDRGFLYERTTFDALEMALADKWEAENANGRPIIDMISGRDATPGERYVAASVVQWLGTNVGFSFLNSCMTKAGYAIVGQCPQPGYPEHFDEPVLASMAKAQAHAEYCQLVTQAERRARQLLFDLAEAT